MNHYGRDNVYEQMVFNSPHRSTLKEHHEDFKEEMIFEITQHMENVLEALHINWSEDPSMKETPRRVAKLLVETMRGRFDPEPKIKDFDNALNVDQMYTVGPVEIRSMCSHHLVPIIGEIWFGVIPNQNGRLLGLSKFARLADWVFARPHMQEEATKMLTDKIENLIAPRGLAIVVRAKHMCTVWRGVKQSNSAMVTTEMRGLLKENAEARNEFLQTIKGLGY